MNAPGIVSLISAFGAGVGVGYLIFEGRAHDKLKKEYLASTASMRRAMEASRIDAETPVATEEELMAVTGDIEKPTVIKDARIHSVSLDDQPNVFGGTVQAVHEGPNPYHTAVEATATPAAQFVAGGVNDYGVSYIEEEEYSEEDGRFKGQVTVDMINFSEPAFFMDGVEIRDWDQRLGDSILVDLNAHAATGVLYVRNHERDEDYEVIIDNP